MNFIKLFLRYFIFGRFYIALGAMSMAAATATIFYRHAPSLAMLFFIFFATLFAYNIYYIKLKKPDFPFHKQVAMMAFLLACTSLYFATDINYYVLACLGLCACLYTFHPYLPFTLFSHPLVKIFLLTTVWVLTVVIIPLVHFSYFGKYGLLYVLHQFIFIFILNYLFDIKDLEYDELQNKKTLATWFKDKAYQLIPFFEMALIFMLFLMMMKQKYFIPYLIPLLIANFILSVSIRFSKEQKDLGSYLVFIDGLLLLQSLLILGTYYFIYIY